VSWFCEGFWGGGDFFGVGCARAELGPGRAGERAVEASR
jgi:hypothetical protein